MKKFWPAFVLFFFVAVFFYRTLFCGEVFYFGDNFSLFLPVLEFFTSQIRAGKLPFWNPYLFSGVPILADLGLGILNPLNFLFFFFSGFRALTWLAILEIFLAGFFCFLFLRSLKRSRLESVLAGVVFAFSASLLTYINNISLLSTAYLLPLVFYFGQKALSEKRLFWSVGLGAVMAVQIISGHPQPVFYTFAAWGIYLLFYPDLSLGKKLKRGLLGFLAFLSLSAFALLPFLELVRFSTRSGSDFAYITAWSFHPLLLLNFFLPQFFGSAVRGLSWGPLYRAVAGNTGYFGWLSLLVIFAGLFKKKKSFPAKFFLSLFFLTILLAMGKYTPLFWFFYKLFPGFALFRSPTQILLLTNFCAAVLTGLLWPHFLACLKKKKIKRLSRALFLLAILAFFVLTITLIGKKNFFVVLYQWLLKKTSIAASPFHNFKVDEAIFSHLLGHLFLANLIFLVFLSVIRFYQREKLSAKFFSFLSLFLIFVNLFAFNRNNYFSVKPALFKQKNKAAEFLKDQEGHWRFISSAGYWPFTGLNVYWENMTLRPPLAPSVFTSTEAQGFDVLKNRLRTLPPNWGLEYQLATPMGYGDLLLKDYAEFMSQKTGRINVNEVDSLSLDDERLNLLGVKYWLVDSSFSSTVKEIGDFGHFSLVKEVENVKIYENQNVLPRAFLENQIDKSEAVGIVDYQPNRIELKVETDKIDKVILTDVYYPAWKALVDGEEKKIERYQGIFRAVEVWPGEEKVEFVFRPKSFYLGAKISLMGVLLIGLIFLI